MINILSTLLTKILILWIISLGSQVTWALQDNQESTNLIAVQTQDNRTHKLVFVYVHGLGGKNKETPFVHNLKEFIKENQFANFKAVHYSWDSPIVRWRVAASDFLDGKKKAEHEATQFALDILGKYERHQTPYYLIAHSLGTYIIAKSFEYQKTPLRMLRGIFFLGAALPRDYQINTTALPPKLKIISYYSKLYDQILPFFYNIAGIKSGGQVGFDDLKCFQNFRTTCTHSFKGIGFHRDYSTLAEAIGYIIMLKENIFIAGQKFKLKKKKIMGGLLSWHDVFELTEININGKTQNVLIQQRWNTHNYRIVIKDKRGRPYQLAKGRSLHAMLRALMLY